MAPLGRPRAFDRDAALEAAMLLFWRKGFAAASMNDLCDAMGVRSPSLYAAFGSKEALYLEAIERYARTVGDGLWARLSEGPARAGVQNLLLAATDILPECGVTPPGCMIQLAAVGDEWPDAVANVGKQIRLESLHRLRTRLRAAVKSGELPAKTDIDRLSRFYLGIIQGMAIQARDGATAAELHDVALAAMDAWPREA